MRAATRRETEQDFEPAIQTFSVVAAEVLAGLAATPKHIAPKYFYDQQGSELFDAITRLDEYYLPRVERQIFQQHRDAMCTAIGAGVTLVEPGAGSCEKVKWLLPELAPAEYVPMDISAEHLQASAQSLNEVYPDLSICPQVCDHTVGMAVDVDSLQAPPVFFYPGSSIGNFEPSAATEFMRSIRELICNQGGLLIGVDTKKDVDVLHAAYNDAAGVTADFNLNVLEHLNTLLDGDLDPEQFEHHALYNQTEGRIEMHLRCTAGHTAELAGQAISFAQGELVHTESSYKYHPDEFTELASQAGLARRELWQDERGWFSVMYFEPA